MKLNLIPVTMDTQAKALNDVLSQQNPNVLEMLSEKGKNIFFPKLGILAQSAQAKGKEINATIGEAIADEGISMFLPEFSEYLKLGPENIYPYAPSFGKKELRDSWKEFIYKKNPSLGNYPISLAIATNGLTHGLSMTGYMFANEGDAIVMPDLFWENYSLVFERAYGAKINTFELFDKQGFNIASFSNTLNNVKGDKIIVLLNFPNNPSGYTPTVNEVKSIVEEIKKCADKGKNMAILIDDAYFGLVYEENVYTESIFVQLSQLHEKVLAIKLDGPTKEDYVWGFRVGFITYGIKNGNPALYESLENKTAGAVRGNISNISNLSQSLLYKVYQSAKYWEHKKEKYEILKDRYVALKLALSDSKYASCFEPVPYNSGYFMCVKVKAGIEGEQVRKVLLEKYSTGVIVFGDLIRIAFSSVPKKSIPQLIENIYKACIDVKK